jgi:hypothetical protein
MQLQNGPEVGGCGLKSSREDYQVLEKARHYVISFVGRCIFACRKRRSQACLQLTSTDARRMQGDEFLIMQLLQTFEGWAQARAAGLTVLLQWQPPDDSQQVHVLSIALPHSSTPTCEHSFSIQVHAC